MKDDHNSIGGPFPATLDGLTEQELGRLKDLLLLVWRDDRWCWSLLALETPVDIERKTIMWPDGPRPIFEAKRVAHGCELRRGEDIFETATGFIAATKSRMCGPFYTPEDALRRLRCACESFGVVRTERMQMITIDADDGCNRAAFMAAVGRGEVETAREYVDRENRKREDQND